MPVTSAPLAHGAVGVDSGRITYVGPADAAPAAAHVVQLGEAFLLPGLVNAHSHLELTVMRGFLEQGPFRPWLLRLTSAREKVLDEAALRAAARVGIAEGLLAGVTTFADTSASGVVIDALTHMRVRGISYQEVFGPDPRQCATSLGELRQRIARLRESTSSLVRLGLSPHAPYTVSDDLYRAVAALALAEQLPVAVHIAESREETEFVVHGEGPFADGWRARGIPVVPRAASPIALLAATGLLAARPLLIHCVQASNADIDLIAAANCAVVHCPASNAKLGHGIAPLAPLLEAGVTVALGSDSVASSNQMDLIGEARLAALFAHADGSTALDARGALALATIGGATALGMEAQTGSLEVGKSADLAAFRVDPVRDEPVHDPAAALIYATGGRRALLVCVGGEELVRDGRLVVSLDEDLAAMKSAADRLARSQLASGT